METTGIIWGLYRDYRVYIGVYIRAILGSYIENGQSITIIYILFSCYRVGAVPKIHLRLYYDP